MPNPGLILALGLWIPAVPAQEAAPTGGAAATDPALRLSQAVTGEPASATSPLLQPPVAPLPSPLASAATARSTATTAAARRRSAIGTLASLRSGGTPVMIGDLGPPARLLRVNPFQNRPDLPPPFPPPTPPPVPGSNNVVLLAPTIRTIKVSENQSPRPEDRIYYSFNYFDGVNDDANNRLNAPVGNMRVYRSIWGFEKTFLDQQASIGLRIPLNSIVSDPRTLAGRNLGGMYTSLGDLEVISKFLLLEDEETGSLLSGGLVVAAPTGPAAFGGAPYFVNPPHAVGLQPFLGTILAFDEFYIQGFSAIDVALDERLPTLWYNDIGIGYFLRNDGPDSDRFVNLIAPTFEVHVNTPLTQRGAYSLASPGNTPDNVNLTYGLNLGFGRRSLLSTAIVTPVTGPQPFDFEFLALLNIYFGGRRPVAPIPPVLGL
ncbi:MAG: hypothetical protein KatS3mg108_0810 [Isosphaeraceae bacterium]|jgi:hypothetical protein|nr:MAG: hypothetical protein KatS3mg108_0810 [Isosphaeraceae bacterium]